jgi:hypothetical protein
LDCYSKLSPFWGVLSPVFPSDETTLETSSNGDEDEDVLFLRHQALKSMGNPGVNIRKSLSPSSLQDETVADLLDENMSGAQCTLTASNVKRGSPQGYNKILPRLDQGKGDETPKVSTLTSLRVEKDPRMADLEDNGDMEVTNNAENQFFDDQMNPEKQKSGHFYWDATGQSPPPQHVVTEEEPSSAEMPPTDETGSTIQRKRGFEGDKKLADTRAAKAARQDTQTTQASFKKSAGMDQMDAIVAKKLSNNSYRKKEPPVKLLTGKSQARGVTSKHQLKTFEPTTRSFHLTSATKPSKKLIGTEAISSLEDERTMKKHFPNLFTSTIISLSDSENEDQEESKALPSNPLMNINYVEANLDSFLKSERIKAEQKAVPPPKPVRKNLPAKIGKPSARILGNLNKPVEKSKSILHIPLEEQPEYKRLKALIKKKENAMKRASKKDGSSKMQVAAEPPKDENPKTNSSGLNEHPGDEAEDENDLEAKLLREKLLLSMKKKKRKPDTVRASPRAPVIVSISQSQKTRKVSMIKDLEKPQPITISPSEPVPPTEMHVAPTIEASSPQGSNVQVVSPDKLQTSPECESPLSAAPAGIIDDLQALKDSEKMLFLSRIAMIQRLTKLFDENNLYMKETTKRRTTEKFAEDLRNQLSQVEEILENQDRRLNQLRATMKGTFNDIIPLGRRMGEAENLCLYNGLIVHGSKYSVSKKGTEKIEELWSGIRQNVKCLMELENEDKQSCGKVAAREDPGSSFVKNSEPVSHLDKNSEPVSSLDPSPETACDQAIETVMSSLATEDHQQPNLTNPEIENAHDKVEPLCSDHSMFEGTALEHLYARFGIQLNPFQDLCPFWLTGLCNDDACQFQHT